jgi:hypothetical protein
MTMVGDVRHTAKLKFHNFIRDNKMRMLQMYP